MRIKIPNKSLTWRCQSHSFSSLNDEKIVPAVSSSLSSISLRSATSSLRSSVGKGFPSAVRKSSQNIELKVHICKFRSFEAVGKKLHICFQILILLLIQSFFWFPQLGIPSKFLTVFVTITSSIEKLIEKFSVTLLTSS